MGILVVRANINQDASELVEFLRAKGHGVTVVGQGITGKVNLIFMVIKRGELGSVAGFIKKYHSQAFYSVEDVRQVSRGVSLPGNRSEAAPDTVEKGGDGAGLHLGGSRGDV